MHCPTCTTTRLVMTVRDGVEIDYCPHCRGVWLDRGELDKLIERSETWQPAHSAARSGRAAHREPHGRPRRGGSWLADIFD
jgi:Zn-finger nucleic acid-binding protein